MFQSGAEVNMVDFSYIVFIGEAQIIRAFIEPGFLFAGIEKGGEDSLLRHLVVG